MQVAVLRLTVILIHTVVIYSSLLCYKTYYITRISKEQSVQNLQYIFQTMTNTL
jgi:hypothetical protein